MLNNKSKSWQYIKSKISIFRALATLSCLLLCLSLVQVSAFAANSFISLDEQFQLKKQNNCNSCSDEKINQVLSPRDEFIVQTYFSHKNFQPDSDEPLEVLQEHVKGQDLLGAGKFDEAVALFDSLIKQYPDARHANEGMAIALKERFNSYGDLKDLQSSSEYFIKAIEKAIKVNVVPFISMQVGADLGKLGETEKLNSIFEQLNQQFPNDGLVANAYAHSLAVAKDPRADEWFKKAVSLKVDAAPIEYSEWLLDQQRYSEVLDILDPDLDPDGNNRDLHFLRGYALERLGEKDKAQAEYDIIKAKTTENGAAFSFNSKYLIEGSQLQKNLTFENSSLIEPKADCTGLANLKKMIMCEAGGEGQGGARAVGWVARNRAIVGSRECVYVNNSGSTLCDKYNSVVTQSGQFVYTCGTTPNSVSVNAATDVWDGWAPEPSVGVCPSDSGRSGTACTGTCTTPNSTVGYALGDIMFYSTTGSCPSQHPSASCTSGDGKLCGNGGSDHCFYWVPRP